MATQERLDEVYMAMAEKLSELSHAQRAKVGALIVKDTHIIAEGYNGTPAGFENECEESDGSTKWYTLHAEANAILKLCKIGGASSSKSTLYLTLSPCKECAKLILQAGIASVKFKELYRDQEGINFLKKAGIAIKQIE